MKLRNQAPGYAAWYTDNGIAEHYSISRAQVWNWVNDGLLPPGVVIGKRSRRWPGSAIQALDERLQKQIEAA